MADLRRLSKMLATKQNPIRVKRMWQAIDTARHAEPKTYPRWRLSMATLSVCVVLALVAFLLWPVSKAGPLTLYQGEPVQEQFIATQTIHHQFSDGSSFHLKPGGAMRLVENTGHRVVFALDEGEARFDIQPGGPRVWRVNCSGVFITVVGTAFFCRADSEKVTVAVERGAVLVDGKGMKTGQQRLMAGDEIEVRTDSIDEPLETVEKHMASGAHKDAALEEPIPETDSIATPPRQRSPHSGWKIHAEAGDFETAFDRLGATKVAALSKRSTDVDELFQLADVARLSGHPADAVIPLETIIRKFNQNPRAGLAAYTLGRLYLDHLGSPEKATRAFEQSLALGLPDALKEAAAVKQIRALLLYDKIRANMLISEYLATYPNGRYRKKVEQWKKK